MRRLGVAARQLRPLRSAAVRLAVLLALCATLTRGSGSEPSASLHPSTPLSTPASTPTGQTTVDGTPAVEAEKCSDGACAAAATNTPGSQAAALDAAAATAATGGDAQTTGSKAQEQQQQGGTAAVGTAVAADQQPTFADAAPSEQAPAAAIEASGPAADQKQEQAEPAGTAAAVAAEQPPTEQQPPVATEPPEQSPPEQAEPSPQHAEQQHNFALSKEGAKVLASNREARKPGALLDDDSDTFLKNDCRAPDKWVMLELSQVAKISRLELAQFELYSARVKEFTVHGRQSHPRTDGFGAEYARTLNSTQWAMLGNFTAEKVKGSQVFALERPRWVRYLLLRFLTQHGPEPVCAVNGVNVYGKSAVEELEDQLATELQEEGLQLLQSELAPGAAGSVAVAPAPEPEAPAAPPTAAEPPAAEALAAADAQAGAAPEAQVAAQAGALGSAIALAEQPPAPAQQQQQQQGGQVQPAAGNCDQPGEQAGAAEGSCTVPGNGGKAEEAAEVVAAQPSSSAPPPSPKQQPGAVGNTGPVAEGGCSSPPEGQAASGTGEAAGSGAVRPGNRSVPAATAANAAAEKVDSSGGAAAEPVPAGNSTLAEAPAAGDSAAATAQPSQQQQAPSIVGGPADAPAGGSTAAPAADLAALQPQEQPAAAAPAPGTPQTAATTVGTPSGKGGGRAPHATRTAGPPAAPLLVGEDLDIALAITAKAKSGGSVYDILVQEIKAAKLQHKLLARSVAELHRNSSAAYAELAGDLASLAARLTKAPGEHNASDEQLAARVDALVSAHLLHVTSHMAALQAALASAAKQQHALLCFLAMMGGMLALNATRFAEQWPRAKWAILLLVAANGLVGVGLQFQGGAAAAPRWVQALPWGAA